MHRVHKCDRRQIDHATEKWVAIADIACTRAISLNNSCTRQVYSTYGELEGYLFGEFESESEGVEHEEERGENKCEH